MPLENYARILGDGAAALPDFAGTVFAGYQQAQLAQQQRQAAMAKQQQEMAMQADIEAALRNPTGAAFSGLMTRYPDLSKEFQAAWEVRDEAARNADLTSLGGVVSALNANRPELALETVKARVEADKAAGVENQAGEMLLDALEAGDSVRAKGLASYLIAAAAGPDKLDELTNGAAGTTVVSAGGSLVDKATGKELFRAGEAPKYLKAQNADGSETIIRAGGEAGGQVGGFDQFYNGFLAATEGGYAARDGKSGAPVNFGINQAANPDIDVAKLTQPEAAKLLKERYWDASGAEEIGDPALQAVHADTAVNMGVNAAKQMLIASKGDVGRYLGLREAKYRKLGGPDLPAWLSRNAKLREFVGGADGADVVFRSQGGVKAPAGYRATAEGNLEAIPGGPGDMSRKLKPVPVAGFKAIQENRNVLSKLDKALVEVAKYPAAFGPKAYLPDFALQRIDPKGVKARAAVADLGSMIINQRSGAAVSAAEFPRLVPFIPSAKDDPATVKTKLENMRAEMAAMVAEDEEFFSPENGYRSVAARPRTVSPDKPATPKTRAEVEALPSGTPFINPADGRVLTKK